MIPEDYIALTRQIEMLLAAKRSYQMTRFISDRHLAERLEREIQVLIDSIHRQWAGIGPSAALGHVSAEPPRAALTHRERQVVAIALLAVGSLQDQFPRLAHDVASIGMKLDLTVPLIDNAFAILAAEGFPLAAGRAAKGGAA